MFQRNPEFILFHDFQAEFQNSGFVTGWLYIPNFCSKKSEWSNKNWKRSRPIALKKTIIHQIPWIPEKMEFWLSYRVVLCLVSLVKSLEWSNKNYVFSKLVLMSPKRHSTGENSFMKMQLFSGETKNIMILFVSLLLFFLLISDGMWKLTVRSVSIESIKSYTQISNEINVFIFKCDKMV